MLNIVIIILQTITYLLCYLIVFPLLVMLGLMLLYFFYLLIFNRKKLEVKEDNINDDLNESNKVETNGKYILILITIWIVFIFISNKISLVMMDDACTIDYKKISDLNYLIGNYKDMIYKETEILYINTNDIKFDFFGENKYLNIENGKYLIPISIVNYYEIKDILNLNKHDEQLNMLNEIEVFKNTKYIKSINGIALTK